MKRLVIILFLNSLCYSLAAQTSDFHTKVNEMMDKAKIPGLSLALIENGDFTIHAFGYRDSAGRAVTEQTIFEAASLTKPVFTYAVLKLVDEGILDLDIPLDQYWHSPELDAAQWPGMITARMILTHSGGLPNWRPRNAEQVKVFFEPGQRFSYSGEGFVYLSRVIAEVTGKKTDEWIDAVVFKPLKMSNSTMVWDNGTQADAASPHDADGREKEKRPSPVANAAASLHTTAGDYAKFILNLIEGTGLSEESHRLMTQTQRNVDPKCSQCRFPNSDPDFRDVSWALGVGLEHTDKDYLWHWGDNGSFKAYFCVSMSSGKGLVYFANSANGLSIRNWLVEQILPGKHPAHEWVKYDQIENK